MQKDKAESGTTATDENGPLLFKEIKIILL